MFTDAAIREIARIALNRGVGARGLRAVVEEVLEWVLFDPEPAVISQEVFENLLMQVHPSESTTGNRGRVRPRLCSPGRRR